MTVDLDRVVVALDRLFNLNVAGPDPAMSRHLPRVYDEAGIDWRAFVEPLYAQRFNGLVHRGSPEVGRVYGACFPSIDVLDAWLAVADRGDLLVTHHPIDVRNGSPDGDTWAQGFVPIAPAHLQAIVKRELSLYACHAPMDTSIEVGTAAAIVEALNGRIVDHFWPYGSGHAGHVADVPAISRAALIRQAQAISGVSTVGGDNQCGWPAVAEHPLTVGQGSDPCGKSAGQSSLPGERERQSHVAAAARSSGVGRWHRRVVRLGRCRQAVGLRNGLAHASPTELGSAGRAGALRGLGAGLSTRALRPRRVRAIAGRGSPDVVGVRARAVGRGRSDAG